MSNIAKNGIGNQEDHAYKIKAKNLHKQRQQCHHTFLAHTHSNPQEVCMDVPMTSNKNVDLVNVPQVPMIYEMQHNRSLESFRTEDRSFPKI